MQCEMKNISIKALQLKLPQQLCEQLGLRPNQTVQVCSSVSLRELGVCSGTTEERKEPLEQHGEHFVTSAINKGNQISSFQNLKASNSQTFCEDPRISEDVSTSTGELQNCSALKRTKMNAGTSNQPSLIYKGSITDIGQKYPRTCGKCFRSYSSKSSFYRHKKICRPREDITEILNPIDPIVYPRRCGKCFQMYANSSSFSFHEETCGNRKRDREILSYFIVEGNQTDLITSIFNQENRVQVAVCDGSRDLDPVQDYRSIPHEVAINTQETESNRKMVDEDDEIYSRTCTICNQLYLTKFAFYDHKKSCSRSFKEMETLKNNDLSTLVFNQETCPQAAVNDGSRNLCPVQYDQSDPHEIASNTQESKSNRNIYPGYSRICTICNQLYLTKYAFYYHKKSCYRSLKDFETRKSNEGMPSLNSLSELGHREKNVSSSNNQNGSCQAFVTNKGKQISSTRNRKASNSQTFCEDQRVSKNVNASAGELSCGTLKRTSIISGTPIYPRTCGKCLRRYSTKSSFSNHKKICWRLRGTEISNPRRKAKIIYPRRCGKCFHLYACKGSFSFHKKTCCNRKRDRKILSNSSKESTALSEQYSHCSEQYSHCSEQEETVKWISVAPHAEKTRTYFVVKKAS